tara:strand:+ start:271 stop:732 length:462 start_codon:yes stop_codon:yes gene_type:complete
MFGVKFKEFHIQEVAKRVADALAQSGEVVLVGNNPENIPTREEISKVGMFSSRELKNKVKVRQEFDLGLVWGLCYLTFDVNYDQKYFYKFMKKALKQSYRYNWEYSLNPSIIYKMVHTCCVKNKFPDPTSPFGAGIRFADVFVRRFYFHDFED